MISRVLVVSSLLVVGLLVNGCAKSSSSDDNSGSSTSLGSSEDALSADNNDSQDSEDAAEDGVEDGLSGATDTDEGGAADGANVDAVDAKIKTNPGIYFKPAGCIVSTRVSAGVWNHVFTNCTGPKGKVTYNGTVKSTWTVSAGSIEVKHETTNFSAKGPRITTTYSGSRDVTYTRSGTLITKHRVGTWTGTITKNATGKEADWTHTADFTSTWDSSSKCYTRDGTADNTVGGREFGRKVSGFKVCGGLFACPDSGELELDRKDGSVKITVDFLGGTDTKITGPKGNSIHVKLLCDAS
jgi:hypothetical protein